MGTLNQEARLTKAIFIAGPTASGKSAMGLELAAKHNGVIINADSMQVYRELRVLSARPSEEEEAQAPHELYGFLAGDQACSVAFWVKHAMGAVDRAWANGMTPIVLGGTGLYFKALLDGLAVVPDIDPGVRAEVRAMQSDEGAAALYQSLQSLDPIMAERLNAADGQRLARALEVVKSTGVSLAVWQEKTEPGPLAALDAENGIEKIVLNLPREQLYERCNHRFDWMIKNGAIEEVQHLLDLGYSDDLPVMKSLGVPSIASFLRGELSLEESAVEAKMLTRRFAKRQMTWFRNQFSSWKRQVL